MAEKIPKTGTEIIPFSENGLATRAVSGPLPALVLQSGNAAEIAWDDFFAGSIANTNTRIAYERSVRYFLAWCKENVPDKELPSIMAGDVGRYLRGLPGGLQKKKQHLAGLRKFFNLLVERHIIMINPAAVAQTERLQIVEGATPMISDKQVRQLLAVVPSDTIVGLRDRAIFGILLYTAARAGAVGRLDVDHYYDAGDQWMLSFQEKRNKMRRIPVSHDLQNWIDDYILIGGIHARESWTDPKTNSVRRPLFPTAVRKEKRLSEAAMTSHDIGRMMKRYLRRAGLPPNLSPHSFRVTTITDLLDQALPLEDVQDLAGHADPRTTRLYDRSKRAITRNIVERIRIAR